LKTNEVKFEALVELSHMRSHVGQKIYLMVELSREAEDNATSSELWNITPLVGETIELLRR
jgi:hypothetical protein